MQKNTTNYLAKDVELRLHSIRRGRDKNWGNRTNLGFKVSNRNDVSTDIPPKFEVHFDIAYVSNLIGEKKDVSFYLMSVHEELFTAAYKDQKKEWEDVQTAIQSVSENVLEIGEVLGVRFAVLCTNGHAQNYGMELKIDPRDKDDTPMEAHVGKDQLKRHIHVNGPYKIKI